MGKLNQARFIAALKTPLGGDVLVLKRFSGTEGLGELFELQIEALSEQENIDFDQALGQSCTIRLKSYNDKERFFCGVLTNAQWVGAEVGGEQDYSHYRLVLRPWFWLLAHRADCRIFLDKDVKEIIQDVFEKAGFRAWHGLQIQHDRELRQDQVLCSVPRNRLRFCVPPHGTIRN